jgi:serine phosphatase RsbU (regulator of sigma subunit)
MEIWQGNHGVENEVNTPGLDLWVYSQPHRGQAEGGDIHYVSLCGGGVITRLLLADVSGHGEAVAGIARCLRGIMRQNINRKNQTRLVGALNKEFTALAQEGQFATAVAATYLTNSDSLTVCNAGHPRPLLYRACVDRWSLLSANAGSAEDLPLGVAEHSDYSQVRVALDKGDVVLFYTDALIEAPGDNGRPLGEDGLLRLASGLAPGGARQVGAGLLAALNRRRTMDANDDVTLLALHHNAGPRRRPSLLQLPAVYAKAFGLWKV